MYRNKLVLSTVDSINNTLKAGGSEVTVDHCVVGERALITFRGYRQQLPAQYVGMIREAVGAVSSRVSYTAASASISLCFN